MSTGKTVNKLLNEIVETYFQEHRLDSIIKAESGFLTQDLQDEELQENLQTY